MQQRCDIKAYIRELLDSRKKVRGKEIKMKHKRIISILLALVFAIGLMCPMQVDAAVKISKKKTTIVEGFSKTLKITGTSKKVKWSSSNKNIATVNSKGKVTGNQTGTCTIKAKVGRKIYKCKVKVISKWEASVLVEKYVKKKYPSCWLYEYEPLDDYGHIAICITKTQGKINPYMFVELNLITGKAYFRNGRAKLFPKLPKSAKIWK